MSMEQTEKPQVGTVKVMKAEDQPAANEMSAEERKELADALQKEIDDRSREITEKFYAVDGGAEAGEKFIKFMTKEAKWKFTESIGVIEVVKELWEATAKAKSEKSSNLMLKVLPIEAIWFFINKVEGVGLPDAQYYNDHLLKPIAEALGAIKQDRDAVNELMMRQGALEVGADFEKEVKE